MTTIRITNQELPVLMEALHLYGATLHERIEGYDQDSKLECSEKIQLLDHLIDALKHTPKEATNGNEMHHQVFL